ncbi:MAG: F0F1 ATP synthase subunit epsilon [Burkholderiales bacterium]|nr:F0F1 ATP synthase subunit epsilon [Burkholderiales bacterium]
MAMTVQVDIVSIEESLFSGLAEFVVAPAEMGEVGIYPGHAPMITRLRSGMVRLKIPDRGEEIIYVSSGMLEVQPGRVTILSDLALHEKDADAGGLGDKKKKVDETMKNRVTDMEYARIEVELAKAFTHLQGIQQLRHRHRKGL